MGIFDDIEEGDWVRTSIGNNCEQVASVSENEIEIYSH